MTEKEKLQQVLENGMVAIFEDGELGLYINSAFIQNKGGRPLNWYDGSMQLALNAAPLIKEIFTLKKYNYCGGFDYWLGEKGFLNYKDKTIWKRSRQISFIQFLKDNNAYEAYMYNIKVENQKWFDINVYIELNDLKDEKSKNWICNAFNWGMQKQKKDFDFWNKLNTKWVNLCESKNNIVWE